MATMRAARWYGAGDVRVEDVPLPEAPPLGMVDVAISRCGICGTDVGEFRKGPFLIRSGPHPLTGHEPPVTLGHEFSGRVIATGEGVTVAPGTRVTADACWRCGRCNPIRHIAICLFVFPFLSGGNVTSIANCHVVFRVRIGGLPGSS